MATKVIVILMLYGVIIYICHKTRTSEANQQAFELLVKNAAYIAFAGAAMLELSFSQFDAQDKVWDITAPVSWQLLSITVYRALTVRLNIVALRIIDATSAMEYMMVLPLMVSFFVKLVRAMDLSGYNITKWLIEGGIARGIWNGQDEHLPDFMYKSLCMSVVSVMCTWCYPLAAQLFLTMDITPSQMVHNTAHVVGGIRGALPESVQSHIMPVAGQDANAPRTNMQWLRTNFVPLAVKTGSTIFHGICEYYESDSKILGVDFSFFDHIRACLDVVDAFVMVQMILKTVRELQLAKVGKKEEESRFSVSAMLALMLLMPVHGVQPITPVCTGNNFWFSANNCNNGSDYLFTEEYWWFKLFINLVLAAIIGWVGSIWF